MNTPESREEVIDQLAAAIRGMHPGDQITIRAMGGASFDVTKTPNPERLRVWQPGPTTTKS